ncbi:MAG: outer membrane protein assembly factor BamE [Pseudomonadota bacterium]
MPRRRTRLLGTLFAGVIALTGCQATFRNHGYAPTDEELADVIVGVDTRASVEDVIGRPSTSGVLTDGAFYYLADRRRLFAFFAPEVIDRQLVAVTFDGDGVVRNIERFTLADGRVVPLSRRVTDSAVQDTAFLRQLLGNLGRFDPARVLGGGDDGL